MSNLAALLEACENVGTIYISLCLISASLAYSSQY